MRQPISYNTGHVIIAHFTIWDAHPLSYLFLPMANACTNSYRRSWSVVDVNYHILLTHDDVICANIQYKHISTHPQTAHTHVKTYAHKMGWIQSTDLCSTGDSTFLSQSQQDDTQRHRRTYRLMKRNWC